MLCFAPGLQLALGHLLMMIRASLAAFSLWAFSALGQGQINIRRAEEPGVETYTFRPDRCNDTLNLQWDNKLLVALSNVQCGQYPFKLWVTSGSCGDEAGSADVTFTDVPSTTVDTARKGTFTLKVSDLPGFATALADGGVATGCADETPRTVTHQVCGAAKYAVWSGFQCNAAQIIRASPLKLVLDTQPPAAPTLVEAIAQDTAIRVNFTVGTDTEKVILQVKGPDDSDFRTVKESLGTAISASVEGLTNEVEYRVRLLAADAAGNVSAPSAEARATPLKTIGLWGYYQKQGGTDEAEVGCSTSGALLMPSILGLWAVRRSRRRS